MYHTTQNYQFSVFPDKWILAGFPSIEYVASKIQRSLPCVTSKTQSAKHYVSFSVVGLRDGASYLCLGELASPWLKSMDT